MSAALPSVNEWFGSKKASIHPTAIVSKGSKIGKRVEIGPFTVIGPRVEIGDDTRIASHVVIEGRTKIGKRCAIFTGACLGAPGQVKDYKQIRGSVLEVGDDNVFREYSTIHAGGKDNSKTVIGNGNFIMIGVHVAHDCFIGDGVTIANDVALAGHVSIEDQVTIGGLAGIHQHIRIGKYAMVGGLCRVVMDIPPFSICAGHPARFYGLNAVGLRRAGFKSKDAMLIKKALKILFVQGIPLKEAVLKVKKEFQRHPDVDYLISFIEQSKRGMVRVPISGSTDDVVD